MDITVAGRNGLDELMIPPLLSCPGCFYYVSSLFLLHRFFFAPGLLPNPPFYILLF